MRHVANEMMSTREEIQRKLKRKDHDIINFKPKVLAKEKNMKLSNYDT